MSNFDIVKVSKFDQDIDQGITDYFEEKQQNKEKIERKLKSDYDKIDDKYLQIFENPKFKALTDLINSIDSSDTNDNTYNGHSYYYLIRLCSSINNNTKFKDNIDDFKFSSKKIYDEIDYIHIIISNRIKTLHKFKNLIYIKKEVLDIQKVTNFKNSIKDDLNNIPDTYNQTYFNGLFNKLMDYEEIIKYLNSAFSKHIQDTIYNILQFKESLKSKSISFDKLIDIMKQAIIKSNVGDFTYMHYVLPVYGDRKPNSFINDFFYHINNYINDNINDIKLSRYTNELNFTITNFTYHFNADDLSQTKEPNVYNKIDTNAVEFYFDINTFKKSIKNIINVLSLFNSKHLRNVLQYLDDLYYSISDNYNVDLNTLDLAIVDHSDNDICRSILYYLYITNESIVMNCNYIKETFENFNSNFKSRVGIELYDLKNIKHHILKKFVLQSKLDIKQIHRSKKYNYLKTILNETNDLAELCVLSNRMEFLFTLTDVIEIENINKNDFNKLCKKGIVNILNFYNDEPYTHISYKQSITDKTIDESLEYNKILNNIKITLTKDVNSLDTYKKVNKLVHSLPKFNLLKETIDLDKKIRRLQKLHAYRNDYTREYVDKKPGFKHEDFIKETIKRKNKVKYYIDYVKVLELNKSMSLLQKYNYNKIILDTNIGNSYITLIEGYGIDYIKNNILPILDLKDPNYKGINKIVNRQIFVNNLNLLESNIDNINKKPSLLLNDAIKTSITDLLSDINKIKTYKEFKKYYNSIEEKIPELNILNYRIDNKLQFKVLQTGDVAALDTVGKYTDCCQRLGSAGEAAAIDSFINRYASVLVLYYEEKILAQSYFHYVTKEQDVNGPGIILDNVEINEDLLKNSKVNLDNTYKLLANNLKQNHPEIKYFRCGLDYNKLNEDKWNKGSSEEDCRVFSDELEETYSDYNEKEFLDLFNAKN